MMRKGFAATGIAVIFILLLANTVAKRTDFSDVLAEEKITGKLSFVKDILKESYAKVKNVRAQLDYYAQGALADEYGMEIAISGNNATIAYGGRMHSRFSIDGR